MIDVTDATFNTAVIERSQIVPVVVDLWAPWCGPCKTLGPIIERVIGATNGQVELVKVNVDDNPQTSQAFQVQGIPAVHALKDGQIVDGFVGAQGEQEVQAFVDRLLPTPEENLVETLLEAGDEASLTRLLEMEPGNTDAIVALATILVERDQSEAALELLARVPETPATRHVAAVARSGGKVADQSEITRKLDALLTQVKGDDDARLAFVDLLELLGPDSPLAAEYRRRLSSALY